MPTAENFRDAARQLRAGAVTANHTEVAVRVLSNDTGVLPGTIALAVDQGMSAGYLNAGRLAGELERVATELDGRALLCDDYSSAMANWRMAVYHWDRRNRTYHDNLALGLPAVSPGRRPVEPDRIPTWMEES